MFVTHHKLQFFEKTLSVPINHEFFAGCLCYVQLNTRNKLQSSDWQTVATLEDYKDKINLPYMDDKIASYLFK